MVSWAQNISDDRYSNWQLTVKKCKIFLALPLTSWYDYQNKCGLESGWSVKYATFDLTSYMTSHIMRVGGKNVKIRQVARAHTEFG